MTRIGAGIPSAGVLRFRNKNTRIQGKQAEINHLKELMKQGEIDPEEAQRRIAVLQAEIDKLEYGIPEGDSDVEIDPLKSQPFALGAPENDITDTDDIRTIDPFDGDDIKPRDTIEYGKDDFYSSQADSMKVYHGLN